MTSPAGATIEHCAIIGDIHAKDDVLAVVLDEITKLRTDAILWTGDVVDGPGSVARCCSLLRQHGVLGVRGNHDRWLFSGVLRDHADATQLEDLTTEDQDFIRELPATLDVAIPGGRMLLCHGVGLHDLERITRYETDYSLGTNQYLCEVIEDGYRVMVNGHTHDRLVTRTGSLVVVNAGAIHIEHEPGFISLDFPRNRLAWHTIAGSTSVVTQEVPIFVQPAGPA